MLTYNLCDKKSDSEKTPLYERLYKKIKEDIDLGKIKQEERLPSKRALADHLHVSITTVENAYSQLLDEGYIFSRPSSGFFVKRSKAIEKISVQEKKERSDEEEHENYDMDFRGNKCSLQLFPVSTWTKLMRHVISSVNDSLLQTVPWNGLFELRSAISDYLRRFRGIEADPNNIIIGAGTEYLYTRLLQLLGPSAIMAFEDPGYRKLSQIAAKAGIMQQFIPVDEKGMQIDLLKKSSANVIHLSPANHFPTGAVMPQERKIELLKWAQKDFYRFIIEDDYDSEYSYHMDNNQTLYSMDRDDRVIYINTFSKSLVPSLRISYMILPKSLNQLYRQSQDFYSCTVSSFEQMTLANFISEGFFERHLNRLQNYYAKKRNTLYDKILSSNLAKIAIVEKNSAGTHMLIRVRTSKSDDEIRLQAEKKHLHLSMLSDYCSFPKIKDMHTLVINYAGMENHDIDKALELLENLFYDDLEKQI